MPIVEVVLYLSVVLSGRCFNVAPADVMPTPTPEYSCETPVTPESVDRPPLPQPPTHPCGCEKDDRPESKPLPLLFLPKVMLDGHL